MRAVQLVCIMPDNPNSPSASPATRRPATYQELALARMRRIVGSQDVVSLDSLSPTDRAFLAEMEDLLCFGHSTRDLPARAIDLTVRAPDDHVLPHAAFRDHLLELHHAAQARPRRRPTRPAEADASAGVYHELEGSWNASRRRGAWWTTTPTQQRGRGNGYATT